ncbi:MAG TPA: diguanylate cyclase, partial [Planctomycetota bacterium]|nr:diguanylate cyclase [Planctomycetota bacterium]
MSTSTTAQNRWLELFRASHAWGSEWNVDQLIQRIAADSQRFLRWDVSALFLLEQSGLVLRATAPNGRELPPHVLTLAKEAVRTGRLMHGHDVSDMRASTSQNGASAVVCAPLTASRGILGALYLESSSRQSAEDDEDFLESLALQAATALEHASLFNSAITDPLTGLLTHRHFQQELEQAVRRAARSEQPLSLLLLDLDHFKQLNDTCGHAAGNTCLTSVAATLKEALRATDVIARFGGDEFEVLLPDTPQDAAARVAEKLREHIGALKFDVQITGTFGVASYPQNALDASTLFLRADAALYEAKEAGRNKVVCSREREEPSKRDPRAERRPVSVRKRAIAPNAIPIEKIDGHELIGRLGTGTNGEVLLVKQPDLERAVALKRPLTPYLTPEQMRAFEMEARVTASLNHPGVVTVHTMGRDSDGRRYYTMKPLEGNSLAHVLNERRKGNVALRREYPLTRLLEVLQRACEALAYAHQRGVYHLDLTPSNIVIGSFGEVTVIDWGIGASQSRMPGSSPSAADTNSRLAVVAGSPRYIAPEQIPGSGAQAGPASDVFALGAIMYEILTGKPPFAGKTVAETFDLLLHGRPAAPEMAAPDAAIAPSLSTLCMQALSRKPHERPTVQEFADRLGRYVRREPEWVVTKFGTEHPLREDEWWGNGALRLHDGEWVSGQHGDSWVLWKVPVSGSFRFIAEGWLEADAGELSLLGCSNREGEFQLGYCFQAAAENNTLSKLSRAGVSVAVNEWTARPGRKYRLELEYDEEEGWVRCYIDEAQIFAFRELFILPGKYIGFYSPAAGAHLRPMEVHRRIWGLHVPEIRVADGLLGCGAYEAAVDKYQNLAGRAANRLEGAEARLKAGICLTRLKRFEEADEVFLSLTGTYMEPLALAERAIACVRPAGKPWKAAGMVDDLLRRFPRHQACFRVLELFQTRFTWAGDETGLPMQEHYQLFERIFASIVSRPLKPSPFSQTSAGLTLINLHCLQGAWTLALERAQAIHAALHERQRPIFFPWFYVAAMANGREDLLSYDPGTLYYCDYWARDWATSTPLHVTARLKRGEDFIHFCDEKIASGEWIRDDTLQDLVLIALSRGDVDRATGYLELLIQQLLKHPHRSGFFINDVCTSLAECEAETLLKRFISGLNLAESFPDVHASALSLLALQRGELDKAATLLNTEMPSVFSGTHNTGQLRQIMLASLGLLRGPIVDPVIKNYAR